MIVALTCFLVVGAATTAILGRDSVPAARQAGVCTRRAAAQAQVSNKAGKADRSRSPRWRWPPMIRPQPTTPR